MLGISVVIRCTKASDPKPTLSGVTSSKAPDERGTVVNAGRDILA